VQRRARLLAAAKGWTLPLYADGMGDELCEQYAVWPERAMVLRDRRLAFDAGSAEGVALGGSDPERVEAWLARLPHALR